MKADEIADLLPDVFRESMTPGDPLTALLNAMSGLHAPAESVLASIETYFNPHHAPDTFLPTLARWLDLDRVLEPRPTVSAGIAQASSFAGIAPGQLRVLIEQAFALSQWRGTGRALAAFLELATGCTGFELTETDTPFHVVVLAPASARQWRGLVERIIRSEKPAYVTYVLDFAEPVASTGPAVAAERLD